MDTPLPSAHHKGGGTEGMPFLYSLLCHTRAKNLWSVVDIFTVRLV